ncbi:hypothetical protein KY289_011548 [Solanum tuberosum]|nr:hypothetical protein KY289_011548 [Solanum tuberosum]KAH0709628.1 hypothetical protein KY284_011055 [Solanum tuberosum]
MALLAMDFFNMFMINVENPIIIDQNYCLGSGNCPEQGSGIKVSDITYEDVHGTSATKVAVKFDCCKTNHEECLLVYNNLLAAYKFE